MDSKKIRYFNLKEGNKRVNGIVIKVNPNARLESRVSEITGSDFSSQVKDHSENNSEEVTDYEVDLSEQFSPKKIIKLRVNELGDLQILKNLKRIQKFLFLK